MTHSIAGTYTSELIVFIEEAENHVDIIVDRLVAIEGSLELHDRHFLMEWIKQRTAMRRLFEAHLQRQIALSQTAKVAPGF